MSNPLLSLADDGQESLSEVSGELNCSNEVIDITQSPGDAASNMIPIDDESVLDQSDSEWATDNDDDEDDDGNGSEDGSEIGDDYYDHYDSEDDDEDRLSIDSFELNDSVS